MSAPDTNVETQTKRHKGPLVGIAIAVAFGVVMFLTIFFSAADDDDAATTAGPQMIESGSGS
ncbi:hypothetical protein [Aestuariivita boseongensis]|uniref:hypothetical protein n=1 Tax=Aestuariivita boseongensis TaxID=1470562 RepID=UPI0006813F34|nr:hypothetical protein [Aestuariivita boseongensis]